jgi:hypothetical protein
MIASAALGLCWYPFLLGRLTAGHRSAFAPPQAKCNPTIRRRLSIRQASRDILLWDVVAAPITERDRLHAGNMTLHLSANVRDTTDLCLCDPSARPRCLARLRAIPARTFGSGSLKLGSWNCAGARAPSQYARSDCHQSVIVTSPKSGGFNIFSERMSVRGFVNSAMRQRNSRMFLAT